MLRIFLFVLPCFFLFSLHAQTGTSPEEYRYLTKGYAYQNNLGLDPQKTGYQIRDVFTSSQGVRIVAMMRSGQAQPAGFVMVFPPAEGLEPTCLGIPHPNSLDEVLGAYKKEKQQLLQGDLHPQFENALYEWTFAMAGHDRLLKDLATTPPPYPPLPAEPASSKMQERAPLETIPPSYEHDRTPSRPVATEGKTVSASVGGTLADRPVTQQPELRSKTYKKGVVTVKVCVDGRGHILEARASQLGSTTLDNDLREEAVRLAEGYRFEISALKEECGTIQFEF